MDQSLRLVEAQPAGPFISHKRIRLKNYSSESLCCSKDLKQKQHPLLNAAFVLSVLMPKCHFCLVFFFLFHLLRWCLLSFSICHTVTLAPARTHFFLLMYMCPNISGFTPQHHVAVALFHSLLLMNTHPEAEEANSQSGQGRD